MTQQTLSSCIFRTLQKGEMDADFPSTLLTPAQNKVKHRLETKHWDYKQELKFADAHSIAEVAKDILAFHNTDGGVIIAGISDEYTVKGVHRTFVLDTKEVRDKVRIYAGPLDLFSTSIEIGNDLVVWLIFVRKFQDSPQAILKNGPNNRAGKPIFVRGDYFYRDSDEVRRCISDGDIERVFRGFSTEHLNAYNYEIDIAYFRLLNPNFEKFIGRREIIDDVKHLLESRHPVIALDGLGGVGKTAIAIQAVRELYDEKRYLFIVSLSAKSRVWLGYVNPRRAAFAGLRGLILELADVLGIPHHDDTDQLKRSLITLMTNVNGLIFIDNLEEISDPGVLKFLSREVPDPVKVLVTSRIDKNLGALTISIPEMESHEAQDLLRAELDRLGCEIGKNDEEHLQSVLTSSGGLPLAIKWAAQTASETRSLRSASSILRGRGTKKEELLTFCFTTMYDSLGAIAKQAAQLIPYLNVEWKAMTLSVALDQPMETIKAGIYELSDKGIIFPALGDKDGYTALPLMMDYLFNKWNEDASGNREAIKDRLADAFSSDDGFLLDWPENRRVDVIRQRVPEMIKNGEFHKALQLTRLAQSWLKDTKLRFLEGHILYKSGNRDAGITHMRLAVDHDRSEQVLDGADLFFFANSLLVHGGRNAERMALEAVLTGLERGGQISHGLLIKYVECNLQRRDHSAAVTILDRLTDIELLATGFDALGSMLNDNSFMYTYEKQLASAVNRLCAPSYLEEDRRQKYLTNFDKLARLGSRNT